MVQYLLMENVIKNQIDFVAIGDTVVDVFIRLNKDHTHTTCTIDNERCEICMPFGSKLPYDFEKIVYAVGNSANASVAAARLGLTSALITNLGSDDNGKKCLQSLNDDSVDTQYIATHEKIKTNCHYVLWFDTDRTILVKHEAFPYTLPLDDSAPRWFYVSSLGESSYELHNDIASYIEKHPETNLAFQPGTFQLHWGVEKLKNIYTHTKVFFCNKEEAQLILKTGEHDVKKLAGMLSVYGPKIIVITDGPKGAYMYDGNDTWYMPPYPDIQPPYERTGAGDAFASTFISALALGKTPREALLWAPINSMSVVQKIGAQEGLLSRDVLEKLLANASTNYKVVKY